MSVFQSTGWMNDLVWFACDLWWLYQTGSHTGQLSLVISPWISAMSTDDGFGHRWGRNGEFCVVVGLLRPCYQDSWYTGLLCAKLIWF